MLTYCMLQKVVRPDNDDNYEGSLEHVKERLYSHVYLSTTGEDSCLIMERTFEVKSISTPRSLLHFAKPELLENLLSHDRDQGNEDLWTVNTGTEQECVGVDKLVVCMYPSLLTE